MENKIKIVVNALKISAIEEHLVNNRDCASKYNLIIKYVLVVNIIKYKI